MAINNQYPIHNKLSFKSIPKLKLASKNILKLILLHITKSEISTNPKPNSIFGSSITKLFFKICH